MNDEAPDDPAHDTITRIMRMLRNLSAPDHSSLSGLGLDFADVRSGVRDAGEGYFGEGEASGPGRATKAAELALADLKQHVRDRKKGGP